MVVGDSSDVWPRPSATFLGPSGNDKVLKKRSNRNDLLGVPLSRLMPAVYCKAWWYTSIVLVLDVVVVVRTSRFQVNDSLLKFEIFKL